MEHLVLNISLGVACLIALCAPATPQSSTSDPECVIADRTSPPSLTGSGGHAPHYKFTYSADADEEGKGKMRKFIYHHVIRNEHQQNVLNAEWDSGGVSFEDILPGSCGSHQGESDLEPAVDHASLIFYGPAKQFPVRAPAYVPRSGSQAVAATDTTPRSLATRLYGKLMWNKDVFTLDISLQASVFPADRAFNYSITNRSSGELIFRIDRLTARWTDYKLLEAAVKNSDWTPAKQGLDSFQLGSDRTIKLSLTAPADTKGIQEERADLTVFKVSASDQLIRIARGAVSVYVPPPATAQK